MKAADLIEKVEHLKAHLVATAENEADKLIATTVGDLLHLVVGIKADLERIAASLETLASPPVSSAQK